MATKRNSFAIFFRIFELAVQRAHASFERRCQLRNRPGQDDQFARLPWQRGGFLESGWDVRNRRFVTPAAGGKRGFRARTELPSFRLCPQMLEARYRSEERRVGKEGR